MTNEHTPDPIESYPEPGLDHHTSTSSDETEQWWQDVRFWKRFHLFRVLLWAILLPFALLTPLKESVPFLVALSVLAPLLSDLSAWQGARAEESADDAETIADAVYRRIQADPG